MAFTSTMGKALPFKAGTKKADPKSGAKMPPKMKGGKC